MPNQFVLHNGVTSGMCMQKQRLGSTLICGRECKAPALWIDAMDDTISLWRTPNTRITLRAAIKSDIGVQRGNGSTAQRSAFAHAQH